MPRPMMIVQTPGAIFAILGTSAIGVLPGWQLILLLLAIFGPMIAHLLIVAFHVFVEQFMTPVLRALGQRRVARILSSDREQP